MTDIHKMLSPFKIRVVKMYLSGTSPDGIISEYGISISDLREWIRIYLCCSHLMQKEQRCAEILKQEQQKKQDEICKNCPWRNNGLAVCVLPRCFQYKAGRKGSDSATAF